MKEIFYDLNGNIISEREIEDCNPEPIPEPIDEESTTLDLLADHEERLCMLELNSET